MESETLPNIDDKTYNLDSLGKYLLQENFLLTALELNYELLERGCTIQCLNDFFLNPENFDKCASISLSNDALNFEPGYSASTLDSIDYANDIDETGLLDDHIKVLEFELRKKNEELRSLRERLTATAIGKNENQISTTSIMNIVPAVESPVVQAHEVRALRFLIYEYLIKYGCKLTAVQFSEEIEDEDNQDLDRWEDVGLNCSRPLDLVSLLRCNWIKGQNLSNISELLVDQEDNINLMNVHHEDEKDKDAKFTSVCCQTSNSFTSLMLDLESSQSSANMLMCNLDATRAELNVNRQTIADLRAKTARLETENLSLTQESFFWRNQLLCLKRDHPDLVRLPSSFKNAQHSHSSNLLTSDHSQTEINIGQKSTSCFSFDVEDDTSVEQKQSISSNLLTEVNVDEALKENNIKTPNSIPNTRNTAIEFMHCATQILVSKDKLKPGIFRLADSLDDVIILIGLHIEAILDQFPANQKGVALPLLIQTICLHPDHLIRDQLIKCLFELFISSSSKNEQMEAEHESLILQNCLDLATCLGPERIESELLPQIWSQLNNRPSAVLRRLLVLACGVIAPAIPSRLCSSLLLSVLLQAIEDEKDDFVKGAAIRSLSCVVALIQDTDKLSQIKLTVENIIQQHWPSDPSQGQIMCHFPVSSVYNPNTGTTHLTTLEAACNWLIPTFAEWCLETEKLHDMLVAPYMIRLESLCLLDSSDNGAYASDKNLNCNVKLKSHFSVNQMYQIMCMLGRLVPFIFSEFLLSLDCIHNHYIDNDSDLSTPFKEETKHFSDIFNPKWILGEEKFKQLMQSYTLVLDSHSQTKKSNISPTISNDSNIEASDEFTSSISYVTDDEWPAMNIIKNEILTKLASILRAVQPTIPGQNLESPTYMEPDPISSTDFLQIMQSQLDDNYWTPWKLSPTALELDLCKHICRLLSLFGNVFGAKAIERHLIQPFHYILMKKSLQGYFEFDVKSLFSGVLAGYCCLLASANTKLEYNKVKVLLTNAIFLHTRDFSSLHGVRTAIMCLCCTSNSTEIIKLVILPALRSCACCADPNVRRTTSNVLYSLVGSLSVNYGNDMMLSNSKNDSPLIIELWQLSNQLARDDYSTIGSSLWQGEDVDVDTDSADWACIAVALGHVFCIYSKLLRPNVHMTDNDMKKTNLFQNIKITDQILSLIATLMKMVIVTPTVPLEMAENQFLTKRSHWETLVTGLLQVANKLLSTCADKYRDTQILPWLYRLTEMNNMIPDIEQRRRIAQRLIIVFSTSAFCLGTEVSVIDCVMPGLDRLRLDFVEGGDKKSAAELEQLTADIRSRLSTSNSADTSVTKSGIKGKFYNLLEQHSSENNGLARLRTGHGLVSSKIFNRNKQK